MKRSNRWCQTPPSVTVRVKPNGIHSLQMRRGLRLKRTSDQDALGPPGKSQQQFGMYYARMTIPPTVVIQRQEMASYFKLFGDSLDKHCCKSVVNLNNLTFNCKHGYVFFITDDDLIQDFLWMDCCRKITDKVVFLTGSKCFCVKYISFNAVVLFFQYLLAMTFVYFKRACFTLAEYTRRNFFIALQV